jgi:DNA uptake protein ComE-like DNA-binding protein
MNRFFDFTNRQLKFIGFLVVILILFSGFLFLRANIIPDEPAASLETYLGEDEVILSGSFIIDPNTAPVDSLELLPGIGKVLADRIVVYRTKNRFERTVDITEVRGIGPKLYERLKPYLKVKKN